MNPPAINVVALIVNSTGWMKGRQLRLSARHALLVVVASTFRPTFCESVFFFSFLLSHLTVDRFASHIHNKCAYHHIWLRATMILISTERRCDRVDKKKSFTHKNSHKFFWRVIVITNSHSCCLCCNRMEESAGLITGKKRGCCSPGSTPFRFLMLLIISLVCFGSYFSYDEIQPLKSNWIDPTSPDVRFFL
jgi:hypothetical protein